MKPTVPAMLSFNGGYVDTLGYLALQGLFTAHVTGNFVTIGAALVLGTTGLATKLLALPVFCVVIVATRLVSLHLLTHQLPILRAMLAVQFLLLTTSSAFAILHGPFDQGDAWTATLMGMTLVAAMAIQNAVHRIHLPAAPPSTLMTGTTTQLMINVADAVHGLTPESRVKTFSRMRSMVAAVACFAFGAAAAALLFAWIQRWAFVVPPIAALVAVFTPDNAATSSDKPGTPLRVRQPAENPSNAR